MEGLGKGSTPLGPIQIGCRVVSVFEIDKLAEVLYVDYSALFAQD